MTESKDAREVETLLDKPKLEQGPGPAQVPEKRFTAYLWFSAFIITVGGSMQFGYHLGNINSLLPVLRDFIVETNIKNNGSATTREAADALIGTAVSAKAFVGFFGAFFMATVADRLGRRNTLLLHNLFNIVGISLMAATRYLENFNYFILGRAIMGVGAGMQAGLVPMFLSELSPKAVRGLIAGQHTFLYVTGVLLSQILTLREIFGTAERWHLVFGAALLPAFLQCLLIPFCPESPKWLICLRNDEQGAAKQLRKLRNKQDVQKDIDEIRAESSKVVTAPASRGCKLGMPKVFDRSQRWFLLVAIAILIGQQLSGIMTVIFYSGRMFQEAGLAKEHIPYANLGMGVSNMLVTMLSLSLVDHPKVGRRPLVLIGFVGMLFSMSGLFVFSQLSKVNNFWAFFSIPCVVLVTMFSAIGPGNIPYVYAAEIFTSEYRASAMSLVMALKWFTSGVVAFVYLPLTNLVSDYALFMFIAALLFTITFCYFYMVESKAKTPVEVQKELTAVKPKCL